MECKLQEHQLDQPPSSHYTINLRLNGNAWPESVQKRFNTFCASKSINHLKIRAHHVILRSFFCKQRLPVLGNKINNKQGQFTFFSIDILTSSFICI